MPEEIKKQEKNEEDVFAAAFKAAVTGAVEEPVEEKTVGEEATVNNQKETPTEDVVPDSPVNSNAEVDTQKPDYEALYRETETALQKERQKTSSWDGRISAANKRAKDLAEELNILKEKLNRKEQKRSPEEPEKQSAPNELTAFFNEFPDFKKPLEILINQKAQEIVESRLETLTPEINNLKEEVQITAQEKHELKISKAHPTWQEVRDSGKLVAWIDSKPTLLRRTYKEVCSSGDTQDVIEMFTAYFDETSEQPRKTNYERASLKAEEEMVAVPSSPSWPKEKNEIPKDDFDSAWNEAVHV